MSKATIEDAPRGAAFLRNKVNGKIRVVTKHSEFDELISQRQDDGVTPVWEQTSQDDAAQHGPVDERVNAEPVETIADVEGVPKEVEQGTAPEPPAEPPSPDAPPEFDVQRARKPELEAEAKRRGVEVKGTGKKDGEITVRDLRAALS